jgi:hypothetical protein
MTILYAQLYCTIAEVDQDLNLLGSESAGNIMAKIRAASDFLAKEIGAFLPVAETRAITGDGGEILFIPPLLRLDALTVDGVSLSAADYQLGPLSGHWPNGPHTWLEFMPFRQLSQWSCYQGGNVLSGLWGLYNRSESLGATLAANQGVSTATLQVSNGAQISPGMVALVESEQELVESTGAPTAAVTTLGVALDPVSEILTLANGSLLNVGEVFRIGLEQFKVLDINGNTTYATRGWNRTARVPHATGAAVDVYRTFNVTREVNGSTAAGHTGSLAISRQTVPQDINYLAREIAGKMLKFAQSGFMGRVGDDVTGQVSYNFAIPRIELEQIRRNYVIFTE